MICDPINELRAACRAAGGQGAWAKANGVSPQYVSDVLRGKPPGDAILSALGIERVYRHKCPHCDDRETLRVLVKGGTLQGPGPWVPIEELDRAVRAENERCALLLEEWAQHYRKHRDPGMANYCQAMANRIRRLALATPSDASQADSNTRSGGVG